MSGIKLTQISESEVEVSLSPETPMEMVNQLEKGLNVRGFVEDLSKSTVTTRCFYRPQDNINRVADELIKSLERMTKGTMWDAKKEVQQRSKWAKMGLKGETFQQYRQRMAGAATPPPAATSTGSVKQSGPATLPGVPNKLHDPALSGKVPNTKKSEDEEEVEKSGYGPKKGGQYNTADNVRRKANNVGDVVGQGPNVNVKSYSTVVGQRSAKQQASDLANKQAKLNRKQPVKVFSPEEIAEMEAKRKLGKSWGQHFPIPNAEEEMAKMERMRRIQSGDDAMANQLRSLMMSKSMLRPDHRQPTEEDMIMAGESMGLGASEEMIKTQDANWHSSLNDFFAEASKPISSRFSSPEEEAAYWSSVKVDGIDRDDGKSGY